MMKNHENPRVLVDYELHNIRALVTTGTFLMSGIREPNVSQMSEPTVVRVSLGRSDTQSTHELWRDLHLSIPKKGRS